MARGLLNTEQMRPVGPQQGGQQGRQRQGRQQPRQQPRQEEESNVTPEEQAEYDEFVTNGMNLIYGEQVMPQVLQSIEGDGNPIQGLANTVATVVMRLEDSAEQAGRPISGDVKFHGATELLEQMAELAEEAGVHQYSEEDMESSLFLALDIYRATRSEQGKLPEEAITEDFQQLVQADKQGNLNEVLPGVEEYAQRAPKPEGGPEGGGMAPGQRRNRRG